MSKYRISRQVGRIVILSKMLKRLNFNTKRVRSLRQESLSRFETAKKYNFFKIISLRNRTCEKKPCSATCSSDTNVL